MIHEMLKTCGAFQKRFATQGQFAAKHFNAEGDFCCKDAAGGEQLITAAQFRKPSQPISQQLGEISKKPPQGVDAMQYQLNVRQLADLIMKCVIPDPVDRTSPETLLEHRLFEKGAS